jgi:hypothetical protein
MDFIFSEMSRNTIPYAPYIMVLIKNTLRVQDLSDDCEEHKLRKTYVKRLVTALAYPDTFMREARTSAPSREKRVAIAMTREVKKLN